MDSSTTHMTIICAKSNQMLLIQFQAYLGHGFFDYDAKSEISEWKSVPFVKISRGSLRRIENRNI